MVSVCTRYGGGYGGGYGDYGGGSGAGGTPTTRDSAALLMPDHDGPSAPLLPNGTPPPAPAQHMSTAGNPRGIGFSPTKGLHLTDDLSLNFLVTARARAG